ncbi:MAG TPA: LysM peptidoglycan-binding domain-containing protein [Longimicrobiaceae bacterium]|nr:LysM peptidoglycan-binding domain-containing protein [Longimicrobiaceae bacterium]
MTHRLLAPAAVLLVLGACAPGASRGPAASPTPVSVAPDNVDSGPVLEEKELKATSASLLGNVRYDLPMEANTWVAAELDYLVGQRKAVVGRWLERAEYYQDFVKAVFARHGLPTDLHHLAMVESGYIPTARSRAGAVGMWQFMPATGRQMGLRIDSLVDERMDPVRSTDAAARHLRDLHRTFGRDWSLAAAAYNAGPGRISRGMQGAGARDFWELAVWGTLAEETKQYVPRLYAVTIIARDRERFGYQKPSGLVRTFAYDSVRTDLSIPLAELAAMANLPAHSVAELNPHLHRGTTPPGEYWVWVPRGNGPAVQQAYLDSELRREGGYGTYAVRRGDAAERLALYAGMTLSRIRELNPGADLEKLPVGTRLRLPKSAVATLAARPVERVAASTSEAKPRERSEERGKGDSGSDPKRSERSASASRESTKKPAEAAAERGSDAREHVVKDGETLWALSREYGVAVDEIRAANRLEGDVIVPGRKLRIPRKAEAPAPAARAASAESSTRKDGDARKTEREPAKKAASPREHVVKNGETLWAIARMYDSTVVAIQRANKIDDKSPIRPGQKLRIPS